ncbi:hypothetical protein DP113_14775 [Brasilonema octagenarum UFV-E1]|uniref:Uncharacterized protein n=2 Tax=Brasilonema TaxID=383614 RepID=A0A856MFR4_9CYAN|nr:hypothetical protein [Brasilonema octagenarum UFV-OR1]QDL08999.1 hypothetical protein DP114_14835 [Brasilonema sennae CENA114]QDL15356.1 hypothetical protein DP113_14775 [Brasilonema octagenarum UFV-E1]
MRSIGKTTQKTSKKEHTEPQPRLDLKRFPLDGFADSGQLVKPVRHLCFPPGRSESCVGFTHIGHWRIPKSVGLPLENAGKDGFHDNESVTQDNKFIC